MASRLVQFEFNPLAELGIDIRGPKRSSVLNEVTRFLESAILSDVDASRSPVTGRKFKKLTKPYADKFKGGDRNSDLRLTSNMLNSLDVSIIRNKVRVTVDDSEQEKADGHNNFSGKSKLPRRPFIPDKKRGERFRPAIRKGLQDIIKDELK